MDLLLSVLLPAVLVSGIYLFPFVENRRSLPFGIDTYAYLWRANLVYEEGIEALAREGTGLEKSLGERPAHPIMVSLLRSATGSTSLTIMWVLPAVLASCIALAAAGLAADAASERRRTAGLVGIGVGGSAYIAWTAVGYSTNLAFDAVALAVVTLAIRSAFDGSRREILGAGFLLGGGALYHWLLAPLVGALLLAYAAVLGLGRLVFRSALRPPRASALRMPAIIGCAMVIAVVGFALAPELPSREPRAGHAELFTHLRLPAMALGVTLPLAAVGAVMVILGRQVPVRRRWSVPVLLGWAAFGLVALVGWFWLDRAVLPYRWGGFALGIPILIVLGALAIGDVGRGTASGSGASCSRRSRPACSPPQGRACGRTSS